MVDYLNKKFHTPIWLFVILVLVLILRIPSFFEPYSYGDELIYLSLGEAIRQGMTLYKDIHDNKPPMLYIMAAIAGNLFWFKAILTFWHLISVFIFWKLSELLFPKNLTAQKVATFLFAVFTTIPLLEGNIVNAELFMVGPTILAFYLIIKGKLTNSILFWAGILLSVASLFKIPAFFEVPAIIFYWLYSEKKLDRQNLTLISKRSLVLMAGVITPITLTFVYYFIKGAFSEYLIAAYLQNFGYLSSWRPDDIQKPFLVKNGPLLVRGIIVFSGVVALYFSKLSVRFKFTSAWLLLTLFAVTLSERPYPHYLIQSVAPLSILVATFFTSRKMEQLYVLFPLALAAFVPFYYNFWHYETLPYYVRFVKLISGRMSGEAYFDSFGTHVKRNYQLTKFTVSSTRENEKVFVWGDGTAIYALSKRFPPMKFVADYHIKDFSSKEETAAKLAKEPPAIIIIQPGAEEFKELDNLISRNYGLVYELDGAKVWKLLSPQVRSLMSR